MAANQLDDVIQRWRNTQEEDLKPEDHELFLNVGQMCIAQGDSAQLLDFISDEKNQDIVKSMGSGLLRPLMNEVVRKRRDSVHCQSVITHLIQICSEDNLFNILLRQVEETDPDAIADTVTLLMQHIQPVLMRLGDSKPALLGLALDALHKQISKLPVPYTRKQEEEDEHGLGRCCTALLTFVQPFVQEVKSQDAKSPVASTYHAALRTVLLKFCMKSLREPLLGAQLDREAHLSQNSPLWNFATEIITTLSAIQEPLPKLLFYYPLRAKEDERVVQDDRHLLESRACLAYLLFVQLIANEIFPAVFSPVFVLQCNMEYINVLLSRKDEAWVLKGLDLYVKSLESVLDNSLPGELLQLRIFHTVTQDLIQIMTDCPIQHLRLKAFVVFQLFIEKLGGEAKHTFFRRIMKTSQHAGVQSVVLTNIKNQVEQSSKSGQMDGWFKGTVLLALLRDTLSLPQGPETDLLHAMDSKLIFDSSTESVRIQYGTNVDQYCPDSGVDDDANIHYMDKVFCPVAMIALDSCSWLTGVELDVVLCWCSSSSSRVMVSLNLLRYLLIRERNKSTGIWTDLCNTADSYVKMLRLCLSMSKSYYGSEIKRLREDKKAKAKELKEVLGKKSVQHMIVKNKALGGMPSEAQEKVLQCALVTYDLMESLVIRIEEILEEKA